MSVRVIELFSGIGGMHFGLEESGIAGTVVAAIDINTVANLVYRKNFPKNMLLNRNIQSITAEQINSWRPDTVLMSPPCQPFTRNGKQRDLADNRSDALVHFCQLVGQLVTVERILLENVRGFETSQSRNMFVEALRAAGFYYQEFMLTPGILGVPNTRNRYYCLARRGKPFVFAAEGLLDKIPNEETNAEITCHTISKLIYNDTDNMNNYLLHEKTLRSRCLVLDICSPDSRNSTCFTKAYAHYAEGTGSVYCPFSERIVTDTFEAAKKFPTDSDEFANVVRQLRLRYFTPREVSRLMSFPERLKFPEEVTVKQKYRLLGNSVNVQIISELIKLLLKP